MMKTEKRKANVGERILITKADVTGGRYADGSIGTVRKQCPVVPGLLYVEEWVLPVDASEYEVIISAKPKKSARITTLETQVAAQREELDVLQAKVEALESAKEPTVFNATINVSGANTAETASKISDAFRKLAGYPLTERFNQESAEVDGILADIERKAKPTLDALLATYPAVKPTANEQRADVIKRAKAFVDDALNRNYGIDATPKMRESETSVWFSGVGGFAVTDKAEFIVNTAKRTVVALIKTINGNDVVHKGIAKCDPDDVFNADIGKAIALARALGVEVPTEFVKAVQPTEVVVGHKLTLNDTYGNERGGTVSHFKTIHGDKCAMFEGYGGASLESADGKATLPRITDDTDAVYS